MPKKETPGVVRQDGTRGGGHLAFSGTLSVPITTLSVVP